MSEYKIVTMADLLNVPPDRIDACLDELKGFLQTVRDFMELCKIAGEIVGETEPIVEPVAFHWIDDGKRNKTINIMTAPQQGEREGLK